MAIALIQYAQFGRPNPPPLDLPPPSLLPPHTAIIMVLTHRRIEEVEQQQQGAGCRYHHHQAQDHAHHSHLPASSARALSGGRVHHPFTKQQPIPVMVVPGQGLRHGEHGKA